MSVLLSTTKCSFLGYWKGYYFPTAATGKPMKAHAFHWNFWKSRVTIIIVLVIMSIIIIIIIIIII